MNWTALNAGVQGFQRAQANAMRAEEQSHALRGLNEQRQEDQISSRVRRDMATQQPQAPAAPQVQGGEQVTPGVVPQQAAPQGAPNLDDEGYQTQRITEATRGARGVYVNPDGRPNADAIQDMVTGRGMMTPTQLDQSVRRVTGNAEGPLGRRDMVGYMDEMERRLTAAGLGHRVEAWRGRVLQQFQSAASRTMALAATAAAGGDMETAGRLATRAYGFIPDGNGVQIQRGQDGAPYAVRTDAQGQQIGQPIPLNPQTMREMAIQVADPGAMEGLLLQRDTRDIQRGALNETIRHNQATEGIARARGAGGGRSGAGGETSLTVGERRTAYGDLDTGLEGYEASRASSRTPSLGAEETRALGQQFVEAGIPGAQAARMAAALGLRQVAPQVHPNAPGVVAVPFGGRMQTFSGPTGALIMQYLAPPATGAVAAPVVPGGPSHSGRRAIREPTR